MTINHRKVHMKPSPEKVIVIWADKNDAEKGLINVLDSYRGTRVYERDNVDPRLLLGKEGNLPYFADFKAAVEYMTTNPGKTIQIPYSVGKSFGLV
jgi:hypothetical protein